MRGRTLPQTSMLVLRSPEDMVPKEHPIRAVKALADAALASMSEQLDAMYASTGRASIPPEWMLKGSLLMALYSVRSERLFCEQLGYNMLFRWFLDMDMTEEPFDHSTFSKNRERLMRHDVARLFFTEVVAHATREKLMSSEHFTVDGTMIEANASMKSFQPRESAEERRKARNRRKANKRKGGGGKGGGGSNPDVDFRGEQRRNDTHESKTDPAAKLFRKGQGKEAKLCFGAQALMENRNGLLVDFRITEPGGRAERDTAVVMLREHAPRGRRVTAGGDKGYDTKEYVARCRESGITPHVARNENDYRRSAIDGRTSRLPGYAVSQRIRKRVEEIFGWAKTVGGFRRTRFRGVSRTQLAAYFVATAYNLLRIARLAPLTAA
jgi:transposase